MAALMQNVRRVMADLVGMAELLEMQTAMGMDAETILAQRCAAVLGRVGALAGIDTPGVLALTKAIHEGPWTPEQMRSLCEALVTAQDAIAPRGKQPKRPNQACLRFEAYPPKSERARLADPHLLKTAAVSLVAGRAFVIGLTCPDEWTLLRMSAYYHAVRKESMDTLHCVRDEIQAEIKRMDKKTPFDLEHLLEYPPTPDGLPHAIYTHAGYADELPDDASDLDLDTLLQNARARAPRDQVKRLMGFLPAEMRPILAAHASQQRQLQSQGRVSITLLPKAARRGGGTLQLADHDAAAGAQAGAQNEDDSSLAVALRRPYITNTPPSRRADSPAASPYFVASPGIARHLPAQDGLRAPTPSPRPSCAPSVAAERESGGSRVNRFADAHTEGEASAVVPPSDPAGAVAAMEAAMIRKGKGAKPKGAAAAAAGTPKLAKKPAACAAGAAVKKRPAKCSTSTYSKYEVEWNAAGGDGDRDRNTFASLHYCRLKRLLQVAGKSKGMAAWDRALKDVLVKAGQVWDTHKR